MQLLLTTTGSQDPVVLNDLGRRKFPHLTSNFNLLNEYEIVELMFSVDLQNALADGHITLTTDHGLNVLGIIKDFELWNNDEVRGKFVDDTNLADGFYLRYNDSSGNLEYVNPGLDPAFAKRVVYSLSFFTSSTPYIEYSSTSWQSVNQFPFLGTDTIIPQLLIAIVSRNSTDLGQAAQMRLYDLTNNQQIALLEWFSGGIQIIQTSTLNVLPALEAIFEIQVQKIGNNAPKTRLHSVVLY